jgi:uncharacterized damage-inducible protein DinB
MSNHLDSSPLLAIFRHNLWANKLLFEACAKLSEEQLAAGDPGAFGTVRATLEHLVRAEQRYLWLLTDQTVGERWARDKTPSLDEMRTSIQLTGQALLDFAARVKPTDIGISHWDDKDWSVPAGTLLTQAINHATEHRTNITTILNRLGIQPPGLDGWSYYLALEAQSTN